MAADQSLRVRAWLWPRCTLALFCTAPTRRRMRLAVLYISELNLYHMVSITVLSPCSPGFSIKTHVGGWETLWVSSGAPVFVK